jgi:hypothetical protein
LAIGCRQSNECRQRIYADQFKEFALKDYLAKNVQNGTFENQLKRQIR